MRTVAIHGGGVAAMTAARLFALCGWTVDLWTDRRTGDGPRLVLSETTCRLLAELWDLDVGFWPAAHPIHRRTVRVEGTRTRTMRQTGWSIRAGDLREALGSRLKSLASDRLTVHRVDATDRVRIQSAEEWTVFASRHADHVGPPVCGAPEFPSAAGSVSGGTRSVLATDARLRPNAPRDASAFEWTAGGWLFTAPVSPTAALVQLMTPETDTGDDAASLARAVSGSRLVSRRIELVSGACVRWPSSPYLNDPWPDPRGIRIGDAAIGFDPICGDGCGHAVRTAILAVAALNAIEDGESPADVRRHYRHRLAGALLDHLHTCRRLYASTGQSLWDGELRRMDSALSTLSAWLSPASFSFRLDGLEMTRL
jgi:2-polyprenyl-6-methoxyphenol hydroxylase-like FAD-dependent oxidoreductase